MTSHFTSSPFSCQRFNSRRSTVQVHMRSFAPRLAQKMTSKENLEHAITWLQSEIDLQIPGETKQARVQYLQGLLESHQERLKNLPEGVASGPTGVRGLLTGQPDQERMPLSEEPGINTYLLDPSHEYAPPWATEANSVPLGSNPSSSSGDKQPSGSTTMALVPVPPPPGVAPRVEVTGQVRKQPPPGGMMVKKTLVCTECNLEKMPSELLIDQKDPSFSWQGQINYKCFRCLQEGPPGYSIVDEGPWVPRYSGAPLAELQRQFRQNSKRSWEAKARNTRDDFTERVRMVRYRKAKEDIDAQYPGEGFKEYRRRILAATAVLAVTMVSAFTGASPEKQEAYREGFEEWTEAKFEQARQASPEHPFPVPEHKQSELSHIFVPAHLMAYLTCIVKGLNMDWLCRHISCLWVIDAFSWVHNSAHEWFRCPKCGSETSHGQRERKTVTAGTSSLCRLRRCSQWTWQPLWHPFPGISPREPTPPLETTRSWPR